MRGIGGDSDRVDNTGMCKQGHDEHEKANRPSQKCEIGGWDVVAACFELTPNYFSNNDPGDRSIGLLAQASAAGWASVCCFL